MVGYSGKSAATAAGALVLAAAFSLSHGQARAGDDLDPVSKAVLPHINFYVECGTRHFAKLGVAETRSFETVEVTVAAECGGHIAATRDALDGLGYGRRAVQNAYINRLYTKIAPIFREAYAMGKVSQLSSDESLALDEAWSACLLKFSGEAAVSGKESAEVILRGALAYCRPQEDAFRARLTAPGGAVADYVRATLFPQIRKDKEDLAIALVLKLRAGSPDDEHRRKPEERPA